MLAEIIWDSISDNALSDFLDENSDDYERIRRIERITVKVDSIAENFGLAKSNIGESVKTIKKTVAEETDKMLDIVVRGFASAATAEVIKESVKAIGSAVLK